MASKAVMDAVEARLATWSAGAGGLPVLSVNETGETPIDGSPFVVVQYPVSNTERPPINQRLYREEGVFRLVINAQRGAGRDEAATWADSLAAFFRDQRFGGMRTLVPDSFADDDDSESGNYFRAAVAVPYEYFYTD